MRKRVYYPSPSFTPQNQTDFLNPEALNPPWVHPTSHPSLWGTQDIVPSGDTTQARRISPLFANSSSVAMGGRAEIPPRAHPAPRPSHIQGWHHPSGGTARVAELLLNAMRDGDLMEEMIASITISRFFLLVEHFQLPFPAGDFGEDDPALAKGELPW